tara:strand:+ start:62 stop:544 length:483 start_codon:yes stop_codon:yes gene_type:complete
MINLSKQIDSSIKEELLLINSKINGLMLLEILKYKLLDRIKIDFSNYLPKFTEQDTIVTNLQNENNKIDTKLKLYKSQSVNVKNQLTSNVLIICISEQVEILVNSNDKKNNFNFRCVPMTGIVLPKGTICSLNYKKNSIILEININEKINGIEKNEEITI